MSVSAADGAKSILDLIGRTPLILVDGIWVKLECANPGGSIKDRIAKFMLQEAICTGELKPGETIVEATSGNTGIALAMVARELGFPVIIWMPEHMSRERRDLLRALGADVRLTPEDDGFEGPIQRRDAFRDRPGYFVPDQFANPENARCHRLTTGVELIEQLRAQGFDRLEAFVAGVGTGGTLMGVGEALREAWPGVKVIAVEPAESAVMSGGPAGCHGIQGIGDGFIPDLVDMSLVDGVEPVSSEEAKAVARSIKERHGYCVGISAGANTVAALRRHALGEKVATVWPDCSDRYLSLGLEAPASEGCTCPLQCTCAARARLLELDLAGADEASCCP